MRKLTGNYKTIADIVWHNLFKRVLVLDLLNDIKKENLLLEVRTWTRMMM